MPVKLSGIFASLGRNALIAGRNTPAQDVTGSIQAVQKTDPQIAEALRRIQASIDSIRRNLSSDGVFDQLVVLDPSGVPILVVPNAQGQVEINGSLIVQGTVGAQSLAILLPLVTGMTLNNDTPVAGSISWSGAIKVYYNGVEYSITPGNTDKKYVYWDLGNSTFTAADTFTPQTNRFPIATNTGGVADSAWDKTARSGVHGDHVRDSAIAPAKFNANRLFVEGLSLSSNSPSSGYIAWGACTVYRGGTAYSISGGNTNSHFVYWDSGNSTFSSADTYTPQPGRFLIATNTSGVADETWDDNLGRGAVQEENLTVGLIPEGYELQNPAIVAVDISLTGNTDIVNESARGVFVKLGSWVNNNVTGTPQVQIGITVDGGTETNFYVYLGANTWAAEVKMLSSRIESNGSTAGGNITIEIPAVSYKTSLRVRIKVIAAASAGNISAQVWRALKA